MQATLKLNKFGEKLAYYLTLKHWSQQYLADKLGTTQQSVSRWVNGITEPELDDILLICYFLDEDPNEFLGFNDISVDTFVKFENVRKKK